jgi:hypothetical protein
MQISDLITSVLKVYFNNDDGPTTAQNWIGWRIKAYSEALFMMHDGENQRSGSLLAVLAKAKKHPMCFGVGGVRAPVC